MSLPDHKTKIICTLGPASDSPEVLAKMIRAGMNIARLNFSHGDFDEHRKMIAAVREAAAMAGVRVSILADLPGPKIRLGRVDPERTILEPGAVFRLTAEPMIGSRQGASMSFGNLPQVVSPGDTVFLNDGQVQLEVLSAKGPDVLCRVLVGGEIRSRVGLNLPGVDLGISAFTEQDHAWLRFAAQESLDVISQSFVEKAEDIEAVRSASRELSYRPLLIAKIERARALDRIDSILEAADGLMIARGDLGVEIPIERIATVQKDLIRKALRHGKPVITATQMLESMTGNRRPTRAEATDVANAILDGADCVMLSGESAIGRFPVEATGMLARIAAETEPNLTSPAESDVFAAGGTAPVRPTDLISACVRATIERMTPAAVFVPTRSGSTARNVTRFRLPVWVVGISPSETVCRQLNLSWGVFPVRDEPAGDWGAWIAGFLTREGIQGRFALLTEGPSAAHPAMNHRLEIVDLGVRKNV